ncbi:DUF2563 family protein [Mycolicibacterium goodii]|uniref:DUF2563 family protein n=1 Tax=Mycolicibacterium goodii TaxID=134601 RepID=A0ABS6HVL7_MYCGD|nr:DUF2563 family protein [Mycolicibacterium goodii]MBU8837057.1 DUF2563 family protein [Mycolicibacterium goodii]
MFVDSALLRCGAEFSRSAAATAQDGADQFSRTPLPAKIFGDFDEADHFHQTLTQAHEAHAAAMQQHGDTLNELSSKADTAASIFDREDEERAVALHAARLPSTDATAISKQGGIDRRCRRGSVAIKRDHSKRCARRNQRLGIGFLQGWRMRWKHR